MSKRGRQPADWAEAKRRCRLNDDDIRMAEELGMSPRSLLKNIPSPREQWKAPVKDWIRDQYEKLQEKRRKKQRNRLTADSLPENPPVGTQAGAPIETPLSERIAPGERISENVVYDPFNELSDSNEEEEETLLEGLHDEELGSEVDLLMGSEEEVDDFGRPTARAIAEESFRMIERQKKFHLAARNVTKELAELPSVQKVVLFGSVAMPLKREVPRFRNFKRAGISIWHECSDVDLAVWVTDLSNLKELQRCRLKGVDGLFVAHHQVEIFLMEPTTDRYLGRLCTFGTCPKKDKIECSVPGCGASLFLKQHLDFKLRADALAPHRTQTLFDRNQIVSSDEIPF